MRVHMFYGGLLVVLLVGLATVAPGNPITGMSVACEDCGKLCDTNSECSEGQVCCPTQWESGVCHEPGSCQAVAEMSMRQTQDEYTTPERPQALENVAFKTFWLPLLAAAGVGTAVILAARRKKL